MTSRTSRVLVIGALAVLLAAIGVLLWSRHSLSAAREEAARLAAPHARWTCSMHPQIVRDEPGKCPICGMDLVPLQLDATPAGALGATGATGSGMPGHVPVTIVPERQQLIGMKTAVVEMKPFTRTVRAAGRVEFDESRLATITLKVGGFIDQLLVKSAGERVDVGTPLLSVYSPDLYEAKRNYELARRMPAAGGVEDATLTAARERLRLWDLTDEQIAALDGPAEPERLTTVYSKVRGVVIRREATAGLSVEPGQALYDVADLSTVWIVADVFETELPLVRVGSDAAIRLDALPGETLTGRVTFIAPSLDPATRTAGVRIAIDNGDGRLKPGMFASVSLASDLGEQLVIDDDAVIDTGLRQLVFVEVGAGRFEPREVQVGERADGMAVVKQGLQPGETIVTSGTFLVDSESRLKAVLAEYASRGAGGR